MNVEARVAALAAEVAPVDAGAAEEARRRNDALCKPPGSLGALEQLGVRLAAIAGCCPPPVPADPVVVVAAADHGVHAQSVSAWPQELTVAMVNAICDGRAAVNAMADTVGARLSVLDVGVAGDPGPHPRLRRLPVRRGTADLSQGPAMTREEAARALLAGAGVAEELLDAGSDLLVLGDMGIANTTAAACLLAAFTGATPAEVVGPGAGIDAAGIARKREVVGAALARHRPDPQDALGVLADVGGLEHAALAGVVLTGAAERVPVVVDGVNAVAAAAAAVALAPPSVDALLAGHRSSEPGCGVGLAHLGLEPLLDLGMRLGEGTGALLAVPLIVAAARVLRDMGTLDALS